MFRRDVFMQKLRMDNPHYERLKKSDLHDLVALLNRQLPATPTEVETAMKKVPAAKWQKYKNVHSYLKSSFSLKTKTVASQGVGPSVPGYVPGKWERAKDVDGHWHDFVLQQKGCSCGPACVAMIKRKIHAAASHQINEEFIRGQAVLAKYGKLHDDISTLDFEVKTAQDWHIAGSKPGVLIAVLKAQPYSVLSARLAPGGLMPAEQLEELRKCTPKKPAIIPWRWPDGSGHWTVCAGPTKDRSKLLILDSWNGIQYVPNDVNGFDTYLGIGTLVFNDAVLMT